MFNTSIGIGFVSMESHHPYQFVMCYVWYIHIISIETVRGRILIETGTHREENRFMDKMKYAVFTEKTVRLLRKNQYTSNVESKSTRTEIKRWVELFFGVKVIAMNSHRIPGKSRRRRPLRGHKMHYKRMIITLQAGYSIPSISLERKEMNFTQNTS
uniref:Large ribosomal subunit protein uL23c n=7 Tax=Epimedium TaxID=63350 RepID=A0A7L8Y2J1_9MAGN|nr:ribosomal protein L23 [Epimedium simplicifolium]YP_010014712.1 ribosomal protein L23 [Epimedium simplicifolium]YP_010342711.1 ribosomal protein L23 [Epimedium truncatum]YP_010342730.1 ribosomal protein L23 [Epimedium truncatum]QOI13446.1 ribosomal protein L23 [Epimedium simplicifolium]QOI13447.1 ribosomal protein L23 [Epimedium simplicifolium]UOA65677.1 ribosomal protein L23 [Epimedium truncatum]UOA65678.1 ribosomal protein L23 [Epimedium truncatum]